VQYSHACDAWVDLVLEVHAAVQYCTCGAVQMDSMTACAVPERHKYSMQHVVHSRAYLQPFMRYPQPQC
jgi:hypothetical protein